MKIIFVTATLTSGGSERVISIIANKLQERGYDVEIACLNDHIVFYPINEGVKVVHLEEVIGSKFLPKKMLWLRAHVKKERPDVVIPFMVSVYTVTLLALMGVNIPVISSVRNDPKYSNFRKKITRRILLPMSSHVVVQTQQIKNYFGKNIQEKATVIYNPVNERVFDLPVVEKEDRIISVGRLYPQKDQKTMIKAFAKIADKYPTWNLTIFGEGPERKSLEELVADLNVSKRINLPGKTQNVPEELNKSKIFCLSSIYEGMSNAMVEAICVGLPILTTNVSGTEELITEGENGFLVNVGDVKTMADALDHLIADAKLREKMAENNKKQAAMFETETIVDQWEQVIKSVVE